MADRERERPRARAKVKRERAAASEPPDPATPRRALTVGGAFLLLGLALVGTGPSEIGMVVTLGALLMLIYGVHTFGRLGPA